MDMSLCVNAICPLRAKCFRYLAVPGKWQSWMCAEVKGDSCDLFIPVGAYPYPTLTLEQADKSNAAVAPGDDDGGPVLV